MCHLVLLELMVLSFAWNGASFTTIYLKTLWKDLYNNISLKYYLMQYISPWMRNVACEKLFWKGFCTMSQ